LGVLAILIAGVGAYVAKTTVLEREQVLRSILSAIEEEKDRLAVLEADWSYLTRPSRMGPLSKEMLDFAHVEPERILTLDALNDTPALPADEDFFEVKNIKGTETE
jgi:hypothetical protein